MKSPQPKTAKVPSNNAAAKERRTKTRQIDRSKFSFGALEALIARPTIDRANDFGFPWVKDILFQCHLLKGFALQSRPCVHSESLGAAQLLYEIALWAIRCLEDIEESRPEVLRKFAPETDVWPVSFRKSLQARQTIIPRLNKISFAEKIRIGKGNVCIDDQNPTAVRVMTFITLIHYIRRGHLEYVEPFFREALPREFIKACDILPDRPEDDGEMWWKVLIQLPPLMFGDLRTLPPDHPLVKMIAPDGRNDPQKLRGSGTPGLQRSRINDNLKHAFDLPRRYDGADTASSDLYAEGDLEKCLGAYLHWPSDLQRRLYCLSWPRALRQLSHRLQSPDNSP